MNILECFRNLTNCFEVVGTFCKGPRGFDDQQCFCLSFQNKDSTNVSNQESAQSPLSGQHVPGENLPPEADP